MPSKNKHPVPKKATGQPAKAPYGRGAANRKRQANNDQNSSSNESTERPQKRQKQKAKAKKRTHIPEDLESVDEISSEDSDSPELVETQEEEFEQEHIMVCFRLLHISISLLTDYDRRVISRSDIKQGSEKSTLQSTSQQRT